jgi:hypothetical protein
MMKYAVALASSCILTAVGLAAAPAPTGRAANYEEGLAHAKATGRDIVVFQRGSDWDRLAEAMYSRIWQTDDFVRELGPGFELVAVDYPEVVGGIPSKRLAEATDAKAPCPANAIASIQSQEGVTYKPRAGDGAYLADASKNPGQDTLTISLPAPRGGRLIRLDFLTDTNLPGAGPGRASNGNFAISEIEAECAGKPVSLTAAWGNATEGACGAWQVIDRIADKGDNLWNPAAHLHARRTLLLATAAPIPRNAVVTVRLVCRSQWGQHIPGCLSAAVLADDALTADVSTVAAAQLQGARNAKFSWWDRTYCPRIALLDSEGRAVAAENKPRLDLTAKTMAQRVKELRAVREKRDALWAQAEKAAGPAKAELLRQSLDLLGFANWRGNDNCYDFVHKAIRDADPTDESGAVQWLGFGGHGRDGAPGMEAVWKALDAKQYEEALALVDKRLAEPRNKALDHDRIQRIMLAKFHIYRRWPGHEDQRFDVQRDIAALDSTTYLGIGAVGYLGMYRRSQTPMITYGWGPSQLKPGMNTWDIPDTCYFFDHAGPYTVTLSHAGGADTVKVSRISFMDGASVLTSATPATNLVPGRNVEARLDLRNWHSDRKYVLRLEVEVEAGKTNCTGNFSVEPVFVPTVIAKVPSRSAEKLRPVLGTVDSVWAWQSTLGADLQSEWCQGRADATQRLAKSPLRETVARYEFVRACGAQAIAKTAEQPGGLDLMNGLLNDPEWLESFLDSGPADRAAALENLRFLYVNATELDVPLYRRLATAMALSVATNHSRYRLEDRFEHIKRAHKEGLLHPEFDRHTAREMRWGIYLPGTARDYQYLLDDRQTPLGDYYGACWAVAYRDPNDYGYSVQGWGYCDPWRWFYGAGLGSRPLVAQRQCGGVCGTLSEYGASAAMAHGLMSCTVGQPGHCAYVIRSGDVWGIGFDVCGPWSTGFSVPGWDGTGYSVAAHVWEPVEADRDRFMAATRTAWFAHALADRARPGVRVMPGLKYRLYLGVGPTLPDFTKLTPATNGLANSFSLAEALPPNDNYALVWDGQLDVSGTAGPVRISTQSDDHSRIHIDGQMVVEANCARQEKVVTLTTGKHSVRVEFAQGGGNKYLTVGFDGIPSQGSWTAAYDKAIAAQPLNYGVWIEYMKALEGVTNIPPATWSALGRSAAKAFAAYPQAGWALADRCFEHVAPNMTPTERLVYLLTCHGEMRDETILYKDFPWGSDLNRHADLIGDPVIAVDYFSRLLAIHHSANPQNNWCFGQVLSWGQQRFAGNPATASSYAKAMESFFKSQGDAADKGLLAGTVSTGIRKASEAGDLALLRQWDSMAATLLPALQPGDVHLNPQQAAAHPAIAPFPGEVLSRNALLQTSSQCQFDRPLSYRNVLDADSFGGWFDTNAEDKPWAQVQLAGDSQLSGIVLVNRYEYGPEQDEFQWAVPLKVSVSADGKAWTEVATFDKAEPVFRVDMQGKQIRARYVKVERLSGKPQARFHFRNIIVYGTKLY